MKKTVVLFSMFVCFGCSDQIISDNPEECLVKSATFVNGTADPPDVYQIKFDENVILKDSFKLTFDSSDMNELRNITEQTCLNYEVGDPTYKYKVNLTFKNNRDPLMNQNGDKIAVWFQQKRIF